jgi:hypothetical protein
MKAEELRVNNWVTDGFGDFQWGIADFENINLVGEPTPIPLTEQWLKDFGFELNDNAFFYVKDGLHIQVSNFNIGWGRKWDRYPSDMDIKIYYVHQLQNLYFALTGEELIKTEEK